ncbi:unnamed protein product [Heligmosomoides polygyrus]|uniref:Uncharacterized protein n=1 Tax=Heligmosomoides polygyrus TaxID=6339 RepID=A0A183GDS3_HELPZ|nr:unnamed protein product [Heligmosomoides polygyrus]
MPLLMNEQLEVVEEEEWYAPACLPLHVHQFILRTPIFLFFFHHFQLFAFVNFKLTCFEILEYAGHPFGQLDFFPRRFLV